MRTNEDLDEQRALFINHLKQTLKKGFFWNKGPAVKAFNRFKTAVELNTISLPLRHSLWSFFIDLYVKESGETLNKSAYDAGRYLPRTIITHYLQRKVRRVENVVFTGYQDFGNAFLRRLDPKELIDHSEVYTSALSGILRSPPKIAQKGVGTLLKTMVGIAITSKANTAFEGVVKQRSIQKVDVEKTDELTEGNIFRNNGDVTKARHISRSVVDYIYKQLNLNERTGEENDRLLTRKLLALLLKEKPRRILTLFYLEGVPTKKIAKLLKMTDDQVRQQKKRSLDKLSEGLADLDNSSSNE